MVCGVRQVEVLSPVLFAVYVDDTIERLNDSKLGFFYWQPLVGLYCVCSRPDPNFSLSVHFSEDDFYL